MKKGSPTLVLLRKVCQPSSYLCWLQSNILVGFHRLLAGLLESDLRDSRRTVQASNYLVLDHTWHSCSSCISLQCRRHFGVEYGTLDKSL